MLAFRRSLLTLLRNGAPRSAGSGNERQIHTLPNLPYDFNALEPIISTEIMKLHYTKHHQTYVNNLNAIEKQLEEATQKNNVNAIIHLGNALKFNGGGHINHTIFWTNLSPAGGDLSAELKRAIECNFTSVEDMKTRLSTAAIGVQGSGWAWLGYNKKDKRLEIATCANQDPLQATTGLIPLFGIDVWEHAYYLQYKNVRADYVRAIFDVANWVDVSRRFSHAIGSDCDAK